MGKGDKRSRRGKVWRGTSGKSRPKFQNPTVLVKKVKRAPEKAAEVKPEPEKKKAVKKAPAKKKTAEKKTEEKKAPAKKKTEEKKSE